jgi:S1-C subfamily serine protease
LIDTVLGYQNAEAAGTGIVLTSDGEVLTNYHVVEGSTSIKVTVAATGKRYTAAVVGHDQTDDIALLQLKDASKLTVAKVDDDTHKLGGAVTAVGNAGGTDSLTAARGAILSLSATITTESEGSTAGETHQGLIETDADVVAGDSGGPLYDSEKEVIGINTAASTGTQINGYAIPIQTALKVVSQILTGKETSTVQVGAGAYLGIEVSSPLTAEQQSYLGEDSGWNQTSASGAEVAGVVADGPAAKAGLQTGDSITALGGTAVTSAEAISTLLGNYQPGDSVKVSWTDSEGETRSATVILAASPIA